VLPGWQSEDVLATGMPLIRAGLLVTLAPAKSKTTSPAANQQLYAAWKVSSEQ